ncbi:MAG TPA: class F sortase [Streptosporangiaceae bacterium]|nr:class F sortase [Streptosporangiaceae bacterium]
MPAEGRGHRKKSLSPLKVAAALAHRPAVVAVAIGLVLLGCGVTGAQMAGHSGYTPPKVAPVKPVLPPVGHPQTPPPETSDQVSPPVSITIPVIGVRAHIIHLGLTRSGALQVPSTTTVAGWYTGSPAPGAIGSSIIAGHIDSVSGPGIFYHLSSLRPHDKVYVKEKDDRLAVFSVNSVREYPKIDFPTLRVYGATPTPQLRLITCGGTFDPQTRHYLNNVIVYATLTS